MKLALALVMALCLVTTVLAEDQFYAGAGAGYRKGLGNINPDFIFSAGVEAGGAHWLVNPEARIRTADKYNHSGTTLEVSAPVFLRFAIPGAVVLAGGGFECTRLWTSEFAKGTCQPRVAGGFEASGLRLLAGYSAGLDRQNGERIFDYQVLIPAGRHLRVEMAYELVSFYTTNQPQSKRLFGAAYRAGLRWYPRGR